MAEYTLDGMPRDLMLHAKQQGFCDAQIAQALDATEGAVRGARMALGVKPVVKQVDTLAAECPAQTNYLYMTYNGTESDVAPGASSGQRTTMVLGCGAYRIGSSVEFDWCAVSCIRTLRKLDHRAVMVNYNPETVSTDYDECDALYFEEISLERVLDIYEHEHADGVIVSVGGQIPNNLALPLERNKVRVLGTTPGCIDKAEDRNKFSRILDQIGVDQPEWRELASTADAASFCHRVGYPCRIRPSYVLSGAAMKVVFNDVDLEKFLALACEVSADQPVVISKFVEGAKEIEVDAVAKNGEIVNYAISEHVENAGVHSGDATLMLPPQTLAPAELAEIDVITTKMAKALQVTGPFNMQIIVKDGDCKVIETNLRASRSCPFSSKCLGVNFIEIATNAMVGDAKLDALERTTPENDFVGVKSPMFSFQRLKGADPSLGVEMSSTGEVACFGPDRHDAFLKSLMSTGMKLPKENILVSIQERLRNERTLPTLQKLEKLGYKLFATPKTAAYLTEKGIKNQVLHYAEQKLIPSIDTYIEDRTIDAVFMFSNQYSVRTVTNYAIRRLAVDYGVPLITNIQVAEMFADAMEATRGEAAATGHNLDPKSLQEWYSVD